MIKTILILTLSALLIVSCKSAKQKEAISKTEQMIEKVENLKTSINSPEIKAYSVIYDTAKVYVNFFRNLPANYDRNDSVINIIYEYGTVEKCFKKFNSLHVAQLNDALDMSLAQIKNLKHDVENGFFTDQEIDEYVNTEDSILKELELLVHDKIEFAEIHKQKYEKYHPLIIDLRKEYEEKYSLYEKPE